ncbi:MAG TPA: DUF4350 domain-containing protein [Candidatus Dormibacteraeota bacterium]|nr:DUF4350 domain-containing protein [Candidatus Dormibacteraeota bacterium]
MKGARGWVIVGLISIAIAVAAYVAQPQQDSPDHSSNSDAANGASAARLFAQAMGHPTDQIGGTFSLPANSAAMFVFTPTSPYTSDEAERTRLWVRSGGALIYASEQGDPQLDRAFGVTRLGGFELNDNETGNPVVPGVTNVAGASQVMPVDTAPGQVPFLRSQNGFVLGYLQRIGAGAIAVLADPLVLCNGNLGKRDNGRLLADLLGLAGPSAAVLFDEYHHGVILSDFAPQAWLTTPWGIGLLWLLVAVFAGLLRRGRSFGPPIPRPAEAARADVEWAVAVGQLLHRSSARALTLGLLASATERAVAAQTGIPLQPRERFWNALWVRVPGLAAELAEAENALYASAAGEAELLKAAQRLHQIARPVTPDSVARVAR